MKKILYSALLAIAALLFIRGNAVPFEEGLPVGYKMADIKLGGLLYDNWLEMKKVSIDGDNPLYPLNEKRNGSITWRCQECHGWDYLGKDGCYNEDYYNYPGIKGIYDARHKSPEELYFIIADNQGNHDFKKYLRLTVTDIWALVKFIREGLVDFNAVINSDGSINGNPERGRRLYEKDCAECHGYDGSKILFEENMEGAHGIGWEAHADPYESLHKIRWGHPGTNMPSAVSDKNRSDQDTINILSYCQTLYP